MSEQARSLCCRALLATDAGFQKLAAFNLHQAVETAYACFLLVRTLYFPCSHNIEFPRSLAEDREPRLIDACSFGPVLRGEDFHLVIPERFAGDEKVNAVREWLVDEATASMSRGAPV